MSAGEGQWCERFTCRLLELREDSIKVDHLGYVVSLPRSQISKMHIKERGLVTVTIPYWLYEDRFEKVQAQ